MSTIAIPTHSFQLSGNPNVSASVTGGPQFMGLGAGWENSLQLMEADENASQQILKTVWRLSSMASFGVSAYYNYRRTDSVLMAVLSGILGSIFPVVAPAITYAKYKNARGRR